MSTYDDWKITDPADAGFSRLYEEEQSEFDYMWDQYLGPLAKEYRLWLQINDLPPMTTDELAYHPFLTTEQRVWLGDFAHRWQLAERQLKRCEE